MSLPASQALPLISKYESGNRNVLTTIQPASGPPNTASGYYQITNPTWSDFSKTVPGASQYPTAMDAPQDVQTQVAANIYAARGLQPWSSNTNLVNAVTSAGGGIGGIGGGTSLSDISQLGQAGGGTASPSTVVSNGLGVGSGSNTPGTFGTIWEIAQRGAVILLGLGIVLLAVAALLFQSKTVKVAASDLAEA